MPAGVSEPSHRSKAAKSARPAPMRRQSCAISVEGGSPLKPLKDRLARFAGSCWEARHGLGPRKLRNELEDA